MDCDSLQSRKKISQTYIYIFVDRKRIRLILFPLNLRLGVHLNRYVFLKNRWGRGRSNCIFGRGKKLLETITSSNSFMCPLLLFRICRAVSLLIWSASVCEAIQADLTPDSLIQSKQRLYCSRHRRAKKISKETFIRLFFSVRRFSPSADYSSVDENAPVLSLSVLLTTYVLSKDSYLSCSMVWKRDARSGFVRSCSAADDTKECREIEKT